MNSNGSEERRVDVGGSFYPDSDRIPGGVRPQSIARPNEQESPVLRPRAILTALRRRWFLACAAGLLVAAPVAAAVWYLVPTTYTAFGELQVQNTRFFWETSEEDFGVGEQFDQYKTSMMRRVTDPFVINAALQDSAVANLQTLGEVEFKDLWLEQELDVRSSGREFIRVSLTGQHPHELAAIVNAVIAAFEEQVIEQENRDRRDAVAALKEVAREESARAEDLRNQLENLDRQISVADSQQGELEMQLSMDHAMQLRSELSTVRLQIYELESQIQGLQSLADDNGQDSNQASNPDDGADDDSGIPDEVLESLLMQDPEYTRLWGAVRGQETLVEEYRLRVQPDYPDRVNAEAELEDLRMQLDEHRTQQLPVLKQRMREELVPGYSDLELLQERLDYFRVREQDLLGRLQDLEVKRTDFTGMLITRKLLDEEYQKSRGQVETYEDEIIRREVEIERGAAPIRVYYTADVPRLPDKGRQIKMAGATGAGLFGLVAGLILLLEITKQRISFVDDVEQALAVPLIGNLPLMPASAKRSGSGKRQSRKAEQWQSMLTESIDSTRAILLHRAKVAGLKTVMITSATSGEGKTTLSCHLATSLARSSRRVLLIDCDIRQPSVHHVFGMQKSPGFCEVICGDVAFEDAVQEAQLNGLCVLGAGRVSHDALGRLGANALRDLLAKAEQQFDFIVVDSAPVLHVSDTMLMAPQADGILLSIRREVSRIPDISAALQRLGMVDVPIIGAVAIGLGLESIYRGSYSSSYGYRHPRMYGEVPAQS